MCHSAAVESTGAAKAEAQSRAEAARIQGEAAVNEAKLKVEAQRIEAVRAEPGPAEPGPAEPGPKRVVLTGVDAAVSWRACRRRSYSA